MKIELPAQQFDINPIDLIVALSHSSDNNQAEFINLFAQSLKKEVKGEQYFCGVQTCSIAENLNKDGRSFVKSLAEFVKTIENENK